GGYFYQYAQYGDWRPFLGNLWGQSSERTVVDQGFMPLLKHLLVYPLETLKNTLPASLLILFAFRKEAWTKIATHPFFLFCGLAFAINFMPYWVSPGAKQRYIYMLFPFLTALFLLFYYTPEGQSPKVRAAFRIICWVLLTLLFAASWVIPFLPDFQFLANPLLLATVGGLAFAGTAYFFYKMPGYPLLFIIIAMALGRIYFDLTVLPQRADNSGAQKDRELAREVYEITADGEVFLMPEDQLTYDRLCFMTGAGISPLTIFYAAKNRISFTTVYYLNRYRQDVLRRRLPSHDPEAFYIGDERVMLRQHRVFLEWEYNGHKIQLVRFLE
ncbi:MAG: hypothetical protein R3350_03065, partial [Saprospiraceae bacterium]|nr:hypothetical protein [Saprospiraceae bacterium]